MAPSSDVVWCMGFIREQGASRLFGWYRILQYNASSAASKISVHRIGVTWSQRSAGDIKRQTSRYCRYSLRVGTV